MKVIIFLGPPGAGKGTQAQKLSQTLGVPFIGMGNLLRNEIAQGSSLGQEIRPLVESGHFPEISLVMQVLEKHLKELPRGRIILDGVPRDVEQAKIFEEMLASLEGSLEIVFSLSVPQEILIDRTLNRYICNQCGTGYAHGHHEPEISGVCSACNHTEFSKRSDDQEEIIRHRLSLSNQKLGELEEFYRTKGVLHPLDGHRPVLEVESDIFKRLTEPLSSRSSISPLL